MVVRVQNVFEKWQRLPAGQALQLPGDQPRKVIIEFNCPAPTRIDVFKGMAGEADPETGVVDAEGMFLGLVHGLQKFEFYAPGLVHLVATADDDVFFYTGDGDRNHFEHEFKPLVKLMQRRPRNPQVEEMMFKAQQNADRRFAMQEARLVEREAYLEALAAQVAANNGNNVGGGTGNTGDTKPDAAGTAGATGGGDGEKPTVPAAEPPAGA